MLGFRCRSNPAYALVTEGWGFVHRKRAAKPNKLLSSSGYRTFFSIPVEKKNYQDLLS
jgi:hypothetical protein